LSRHFSRHLLLFVFVPPPPPTVGFFGLLLSPVVQFSTWSSRPGFLFSWIFCSPQRFLDSLRRTRDPHPSFSSEFSFPRDDLPLEHRSLSIVWGFRHKSRGPFFPVWGGVLPVFSFALWKVVLASRPSSPPRRGLRAPPLACCFCSRPFSLFQEVAAAPLLSLPPFFFGMSWCGLFPPTFPWPFLVRNNSLLPHSRPFFFFLFGSPCPLLLCTSPSLFGRALPGITFEGLVPSLDW